MALDQKTIRNFSIIAHIDHGKSTLADRILEITNTVQKREMKEQLLDNMDLERERGITIKLNAIQLKYQADDGQTYTFHLIDTPGHVDFTYEVSRSLAACEGAILVVDATQGIEAQTLANCYLAIDNDLDIIPVINKIDLPAANIEQTKEEIENVIGLPCDEAPCVSAKTGLNVKDVLEQIVKNVRPPQGDINKPFKALIFDSFYDAYRGVVAIIRVVDGEVKVGDKIKIMSTNSIYEVTELGVRTLKEVKQNSLSAGEVGYLAAAIKTVKDVRVGDTITLSEKGATEPLPGYKELKSMVFCGLYPSIASDYDLLRDALEKLKLNDASLHFENETSQALGFGFRCGFLGLLHMDVIQERLEREFNLSLVATAPSVIFHVYMKDKSMIELDNPSKLPDILLIDRIEEPFVKASIMTPKDYIGPLMELCQNKRGIYVDMKYIDDNRMQLIYKLPLAEIVYNFYDRLKSCSHGYASFDYELDEYMATKLVKLDILLNGNIIDALSCIVHRDFAYSRGRVIVEKLRRIIPRQMFEVPIQAAVNSKVIARETIAAYRKDVLAKCYGGDITRKKKLLEKQKEGKKRMKKVGNVDIPQEAFMTVLSVDDDDK
ncbi:MAG: translation elongation factor 4 [Erysipelotrichaceae bacterium]|nr:translation elongation factor 4 [Erysipelotrichaceae bacterium]